MSEGPPPDWRRPPADHPLQPLRGLVGDTASRVRWACALEVLSPKAGNVHPGASFADLSAADFLRAADALATAVADRSLGSLGPRVLEAVRRAMAVGPSNVNLGIALLIVPLVAAQERPGGAWPQRIAAVLEELTAEDGAAVFQAIRLSKPGGLGRSPQLDVDKTTGPVDLVAAMRLASERDRVARQYRTGFLDLLEGVVPLVDQEIVRWGDPLQGVRWAQIALLAQQPDSLILRKCGPAVADEATRRAAAVWAAEEEAERERRWRNFDVWLRGDSNRRNPGTTADLIAAALYLLLDPRD
jgi:triphosphoribosyl-dephospho-CoA synthase